jgi:Uma2 family endonuclease
MALDVMKKLWTVDEVLLMVEKGILPEDNHLELISGELIEMSPSGRKHSAAVNRINLLLIELLGRKAFIWVQSAVQLDSYSAPEPDIAVLKWRDDFYEGCLPGPDDILLVIEISDTSLSFDRRIKASLYAESGIPEYWILDLQNQRVERYHQPQQDGYGEKEVVGRGQVLVVPGLGAGELTVEEMLGG